jgi:hypothetical protein
MPDLRSAKWGKADLDQIAVANQKKRPPTKAASSLIPTCAPSCALQIWHDIMHVER